MISHLLTIGPLGRLYMVVRFNAYQISASIDAKNNGFTRELRCPPVLIYFTQACREAGVRLVQVTLKDWTLARAAVPRTSVRGQPTRERAESDRTQCPT